MGGYRRRDFVYLVGGDAMIVTVVALFAALGALAAALPVIREMRLRRKHRAEQARRDAWAEIVADICRERRL
jgi:hypothetical protein